MKKVILIFLITIVNTFNAQISISVKNYNESKIFIYALNGENISFIDSVAANKNSKYKFSFEHKHTGFYRLFIKQNQHIDFIYDEEKIEIETDAYNILDSLKIVESESNKLYYQFRKLNKEYKTKTPPAYFNSLS